MTLEVAITIFNGFRAIAGQLAGHPTPPYRGVEVPSVEPTADGWVGLCALSNDQFASFAESRMCHASCEKRVSRQKRRSPGAFDSEADAARSMAGRMEHIEFRAAYGDRVAIAQIAIEL